ncbi:hypothetical protein BRADI_3g04655v3 [Brachypodium distachyon]|uniref:Uncharacterized protein n=1 Tax=Brachypodium distachyon TaxID=15368 RepID=A0A0Q3J5C2_BRADI|nr:hypothetical protein BRADI_3g04655v3 [Brachypodium distachyon]
MGEERAFRRLPFEILTMVVGSCHDGPEFQVHPQSGRGNAAHGLPESAAAGGPERRGCRPALTRGAEARQ